MPFPFRPLLAALGLGAGSLSAQTFATFNGSSSNDWFTPSNWSTGSVPSAAIYPYVPTGRTVVVSGGSAVGNQFQASTGTLRVQNGGTATFGSTFLDYDAGSHSSLQVDGAGSVLSFSTSSPNYFSYGNNSATSLTVTNGGRYQSSGANDYYGWGSGSVTTLQVTNASYSVAGARIAYNTGTQASLTVSGGSASFTSTGTLNVGYFGQGSFQLSGGALGTSAAVDIAAGALSGAGGSSGTALVTGAGTTWNVSGNIRLGAYSSPTAYANATLTVANGATLNAPASIVTIARGSTLSIGNGGAAGILNVAQVSFSDTFSAAGRLVFNHSDDLIFSAARTGLGTLVKDGAGTLTLVGASTKFGDTMINAGTLRLGSNNALGSANGTLILNGGTLDLNGFTQTQSLLSLTASSTLLYSTTTLMSFFSAAPTWTGTLNLPDFVPNSDQLYFANGLSPAQLAQINVPGWTADSIRSGYVHFTAITAVPEPATWAAGVGALTVAGAMLRRRLPRK